MTALGVPLSKISSKMLEAEEKEAELGPHPIHLPHLFHRIYEIQNELFDPEDPFC